MFDFNKKLYLCYFKNFEISEINLKFEIKVKKSEILGKI